MRIVNKNYTYDTFTYLIKSISRTSGTNVDCVIPMGVLPDYQYFYCEALTVNINAVVNDTPILRMASFEVIDMVKRGYNTDPTVNSFVLNTSRQHNTNFNASRVKVFFVVKNFSNLSFRFIHRNIRNEIHVDSFPDREWDFMMTMTPIIKDKLPYYISSKANESFDYIFSTQFLASGTQINGQIDIRPINDGYREYFVRVKQVFTNIRKITNTSLGGKGYTLFCEGWAENVIMADNQNNYFPLAFIRDGDTDTHNNSTESTVFRIKNMSSTRRIRLIIKQQSPLVDIALEPTFDADFFYTVSFIITPIN